MQAKQDPSPWASLPASEFSAAPSSSCFTCRALGTATFLGATAYLLYERTLARTRAHRAVLLACSAGSAGMAILRWRA